ncbi:MAG TPA: ribosomal protein S18-alanine N-acetyltransferase [Gammaproteobacteria bacterium]|nr:ribosomal protein S18-alanine N-acetyltransferase [Gammaproteobacteria bacterium]
MSAAVRPRHEIRLMQPSDLKAVAAVERAAYDYPWSLGIFRDCLLAGYYCLVLDVGGSVTGYGIMSIAAAEGHLLNLCIHPNAQRMGFGRRLLSALLLRAGDAACDKVFLEVRPSNEIALRLYHSVGFEQIGIRPAYYQAERGREDAVILAATLRPSR